VQWQQFRSDLAELRTGPVRLSAEHVYDYVTEPTKPALAPAYFEARIPDFQRMSDAEVLGQLTQHSLYALTTDAIGAWKAQLPIIRAATSASDGWLFFEFDVPRLGKRIDCVVLVGSGIVPVEFKVGARKYLPEDLDQAWDYALDLKNFHKASHTAPIFPILLSTEAPPGDTTWRAPHADGVYPPARCNSEGLTQLLREAAARSPGAMPDGLVWSRAEYQPTPTIVEAAQALYARHSVDAISRHDAGAYNLAVTAKRVEDIIDDAAARARKAIVFVTGVPGAGKTLVGLDVATKRRERNHAHDTHAVFLSGNGPLVRVLREALVRDEAQRQKESRPRREREHRGAIRERVQQFIQNVHHWRDYGLRNAGVPDDHVVIFDEAQRAWDKAKTSKFMKRRRGVQDFNQTEPEFLLSVMNRRTDWAVVICLVGGGQEINEGEAGIGGWLDAVSDAFPDWDVYVSPSLTDSEYRAGPAIERVRAVAGVSEGPELHLRTSMRSFRAENLSAFVRDALDLEVASTSSVLRTLLRRYPIALTRDLDVAKDWIRSHARGSERYGLVASSSAKRLKALGVDVRIEIDPIHWFLNEAADTRSSYYLEDPATEFQIQGLELDWICMTWDADLRYEQGAWSYNEFRVDGWRRVKQERRQRYLLNAYRVLLTRARQGMAIFVPKGSSTDPTRRPQYYDGTFEYLSGLGLQTI